MQNAIQLLQPIQVNPYPGGKEIIFALNGKMASVTKTDYDYFDVQSNAGDFIYQGYSADEAWNATHKFLVGEQNHEIQF